MRRLIYLTLFSFLIPNIGFGQCPQTVCTDSLWASPNVSDACVLCSLEMLDGFSGSTADIPSATIWPLTFCGTVENNQWIAFVAPKENVTFEMEVFNCMSPNNGGIQAEIFCSNSCSNSSNPDNWIPVSNCWSPGIETIGTLTATDLNPGEVYYLMIDGFAGDICEFTINVLDPSGGIAPIPVQPEYEIIGLQTTCNTMDSYSYSGVGSCGQLPFWTIEPPTLGIIISSPIDDGILVAWTGQGAGKVCIETPNACYNDSKTCLDIQVGKNTITDEEVEICLGQSCYECAGFIFCEPFDPQPIVFQSWLGCDSVINCILTPIAPITINLGQVSICENTCFQVGDSLFCEPGLQVHVLENYQGCDSTIIFDLKFSADLGVDIQDPLPLNCNAGCPIIDASNSCFPDNSTIEWTGPNLTISDELIIEGCELGTYCLTISSPNGNQVMDCVEIIEIPGGVPAITSISEPQTICSGESTLLFVDAPDAIQIQWSPPNSISNPNIFNPFVSPSNSSIYTATVIDENGCINSANTEIYVNCFTHFDTIPIGGFGIYSLNFPPYDLVNPPIDLCPDIVDGHAQFQIGNTLVYSGITDGTDTLCLKFQNPNDPTLIETFEAIITVVKKPIFGLEGDNPNRISTIDSENKFEKTRNDLTIFPNPTTGNLNIISKKEVIQTIEIFDISGKSIITTEINSHSKRLDINHLTPGSYFIRTQTESDSFLEKIVLIH